MHPLIPIQLKQIGGVLQETVNARDVHKFIKVYIQFSGWMQSKIAKHGFMEDKDYLRLEVTKQIPHRWHFRTSHQIDYLITVDAARTIGLNVINRDH